MKKKIHRKYSLINIPICLEHGDIIHYIMPPMYTGTYTAKVLRDRLFGLYILESHNFFDSCCSIMIERDKKYVNIKFRK